MGQSRSHYKEHGEWNNMAENNDWGGGPDKEGFYKVRYLEEMDIKRVSLQCSGKPMCTHKPVHSKWLNIHKMVQIVWNFYPV
jgi:hypothetical protein